MQGKIIKKTPDKSTFFSTGPIQDVQMTPSIIKLNGNSSICGQESCFCAGDTTWVDRDLPEQVGSRNGA